MKATLEATQGQIDVFLVNSHTNATKIGLHLWEINSRFAPGSSVITKHDADSSGSLAGSGLGWPWSPPAADQGRAAEECPGVCGGGGYLNEGEVSLERVHEEEGILSRFVHVLPVRAAQRHDLR
jgi:hypothetical protein